MKPNRLSRVVVVGLLAIAAAASPARAQWSVTSSDGRSVLTLGILAQTQLEVLETPGTTIESQNVFLRRARIILGGRTGPRTSFFLDTDVPNLGKGQPSGTKVPHTMILQDFVITQALGGGVKVDAGMLMVPVSHNSQQAVGTALAVDYGPYSFVQSDATDSKLNRDYGVDGRASLARGHAELRAGLYQGDRGHDATAPFRATVRGVFYPFEADTGFFYTGTSFGKKKLVALGVSYDAQRSYASWAADAAVDWPVGGDAVTLQLDDMRADGRTTFASLPRQDVVLVECGWFFHRPRLEPFVQYASRDYRDPARADESRIQGGLAFWGNGHKNDLKLAVARLTRANVSDGIQYVAQWQVLAF